MNEARPLNTILRSPAVTPDGTDLTSQEPARRCQEVVTFAAPCRAGGTVANAGVRRGARVLFRRATAGLGGEYPAPENFEPSWLRLS